MFSFVIDFWMKKITLTYRQFVIVYIFKKTEKKMLQKNLQKTYKKK